MLTKWKRVGLVTIASWFLLGCNQIAPWVQTDQLRRTVVFGDSLTSDSADNLLMLHAPVGLSINAFPGTQVRDWRPYFESVPAGATAVIALGTNDINRPIEDALADAQSAVDWLHQQGIETVWLTLNSYSAWLRSPYDLYPKALQFNQWLRSQQVEGKLGVFEWDHMSYAHDDWLQGDRVHHTATGQQWYAQALANAAMS